MKKLLSVFAFAMFFFLSPLISFAQVVAPETIEQATQMGLIPALIQAALLGKWAVVIGGVVMVAVVVIRQYLIPKWNISEQILPYVSIVLAFLSGLGAQVFGGLSVQEAATVMLAAGGIASQMWSLGGKAIAAWILKQIGSKLAKSPK